MVVPPFQESVYQELNITSSGDEGHEAAAFFFFSFFLGDCTATAAMTVTDAWTGEDTGPVVDGSWSTGTVGPLNSRFVVISSA